MWSRLHRYLLVELLREEGYTVIEAEDGKDALDKFDTDVDVIISDFNMPKMNGAELFWATQNVNVKFILTSGHFDPIQVGAVIDAGASFVGKPFRLEEILKMVCDN